MLLATASASVQTGSACRQCGENGRSWGPLKVPRGRGGLPMAAAALTGTSSRAPTARRGCRSSSRRGRVDRRTRRRHRPQPRDKPGPTPPPDRKRRGSGRPRVTPLGPLREPERWRTKARLVAPRIERNRLRTTQAARYRSNASYRQDSSRSRGRRTLGATSRKRAARRLTRATGSHGAGA